MAQPDRKVYVEWPDYNEKSYRFVNSRLEDESDPENTVRVPNNFEAAEKNAPRSNANAKKIPVAQPQKIKNPNQGAPQRANVPLRGPPPRGYGERNEELDREAAYQADLQKRLLEQERNAQATREPPQKGSKSPIPPLNFTDIDRSSMQEFIREEIDLNLRSSDEDELGRKAAPQGKKKQPQQARMNQPGWPGPGPMMMMMPPGPYAPFGPMPPGQNGPPGDEGAYNQYEQQGDYENGQDAQSPDFQGSPRGEMRWASNQNEQKRQKKNEFGQYPDFVEENKQVKRDKPKKSYVKMMKNKQELDMRPSNISSSAPARGNEFKKAGKNVNGVEREPANMEQSGGFPSAQYIMQAPFPGANYPPMAPYQSVMPPMASTLSAFYQQQVPTAGSSVQPTASNFAPMGAALPNAQAFPAFGSQPNIAASLSNPTAFPDPHAMPPAYDQMQLQRQNTHSSQPDLSLFKSEVPLVQRSLQLGKPKFKYGVTQGSIPRSRATTDGPSSSLPPGDVFTTVTLHRHQSPLPPIDDHQQRVKQNAELGIPASVSPSYDAGYKDMYVKQREGVDYKKYTLQDYRRIMRVGKVDQRLGPDLDTVEYKDRLEKRKRQQMYGRRVNTENVKIFAEEQDLLKKAKEQGARFVTYDPPEEVRERKRLEVADVGDVRYTERGKGATQRTARSDRSHFQMNPNSVKQVMKRLDRTPPPVLPKSNNQTVDILNVRTIPPPSGSLAKIYQNTLIETHRKMEAAADKAAIPLPDNDDGFFKSINAASEKRPMPPEEDPKQQKRELAKQYAEQIRKKHKELAKKKHEAADSQPEPQKLKTSARPKFSYGTYTYEFEHLDDELLKLHDRHMNDKVRVDAIRQAY